MDRRLLDDAPAWNRLPPELPIADRRDELVEAIRNNQLLVVAGETGSGKSTQLPKLCVQAGRGVDGMIGHTQPRRLAARAVAQRVADETETSLGDQVGYAVRFDDKVGANTVVKLMTDGILLAELQRDRKLSKYDTIIIDEAHERSLNIDFLLGYLKQLLPKRPDLHVIITSATIDTERFSEHFDDAPVIEVSGRTYPVDVRYRPVNDPDGGDHHMADSRYMADSRSGGDQFETQAEAVAGTVRSLQREDDGDILVFLAGERDIREAADEIEALNLHNTEVVPLYARLSSSEQQRVFRSHSSRRVVLATNVAETSLTVPGIRFVIDTGLARISRYNKRTKVQRLPIEAVSQASADQRAGRCGRIGPGICVRLYSEADYLGRPDFTEPEIQRTNLASVILQMASLGLGDIDSFPFVEPPDQQSIRDGITVLEELDALDPERQGTKQWLTDMGRELSRFPIDPRFARMIIEAIDRDALDEVSIIVAALSVQDPRERPRERLDEANQFHARFVDDKSDFMTLLKLWRHLEKQRKELSGNQFRRRCRKEFINYTRVREWQDTVRQLRRTVKELNYKSSGPSNAHRDTIHRCLLPGLLSQVGMKDQRPRKGSKRESSKRGADRRRVEYVGTRGSRFRLGRSSVLAKNGPQWVMAAEMVETGELWAHTAGPVDPAWIEDAAHYLIKRSYDDPVWDPGDGVAYTIERVSLYGLPIVSGRRVTVGRVNKRLARELFIHHALVLGEATIDEPFAEHNRDLSMRLEAIEDRFRQRNAEGYTDRLYTYFDQRLPEHITSLAAFTRWRRKQHKSGPTPLEVSMEDVLDNDQLDRLSGFPDTWPHVDGDLELAYLFDQASHLDGLSVHIPVELAAQITAAPFTWLVPGMRPELVLQMLRSLPKDMRKQLAPLDQTAELVLSELKANGDSQSKDSFNIERSPSDELSAILGPRTGVNVDPGNFDLTRLAPHLRPTFRIIDADRNLLAEGKSMEAVQQLIRSQTESALAAVAQTNGSPERDNVTRWDFGDLPRVFNTTSGGRHLRAYPALIDDDGVVAIRLLADEARQQDEMWNGTRRLLRLQLPSPIRKIDRMLSDRTKLIMITDVVQSKADWYNDILNVCLDEIIIARGGPAWTADGFALLVEAGQDQLTDLLEQACQHCENLVPAASSIEQRLQALAGAESMGPSIDDARAHFNRLTYAGFLSGVGMPKLSDMERYLEALKHRLQQLPDSPSKDSRLAAESVAVEQLYRQAVAQHGMTAALEEVTWELEELRVQNFAQHLRSRTAAGGQPKVSAKRIQAKLGSL